MIKTETSILSQQNKYDHVFNYLSLKHEKEREELHKIFDYSINQIKYTLSDLDRDHRLGCLYVIKEMYLKGIDLDDKKINNIIDQYLEYTKNYQEYYDSFGMISDVFDLNLSFYDKFIEDYTDTIQ